MQCADFAEYLPSKNSQARPPAYPMNAPISVAFNTALFCKRRRNKAVALLQSKIIAHLCKVGSGAYTLLGIVRVAAEIEPAAALLGYDERPHDMRKFLFAV